MPAVNTQRGVLSLGGSTKLIQCDLIDAKPYGMAPVLEDEFNTDGVVYQDATLLTPEQQGMP